ncbi:hypothetical protein CABS01_17147 [Colletotrichum abscissum]|uniref:uncharacterized protein n=1 Tax=Colletotrichum abscissum TaxID=1671311 RepID=UPI0027D539C5|nr:uncharacterized protein CABS01_17147 [Colletotrichum abscissum]KAK1489745.1 hypothetical protein CABS01_17147 [Colletotrichum abscissum]
MASATRTTALSLDENHHDDVICLGSRPSVEHITIYHKRITKSRGIRNDEDTTTGPRLRQRRDLPIYKTSSSSARTAPTSPTAAARQKAILTTTA